MTVRLYVTWGDVRDQSAWDAIAQDVQDSSDIFRLSEDGAWASVTVGPIEASGPVASDVTDDDDCREILVVAGDQAPEWLRSDVVAQWGWRRSYTLPRLQRRPFLCDVLLLAPNWAEQFDGWSTLLWFDVTLRPMSRITLLTGRLGPLTAPLPVRVLEVGNDEGGVPFAVLFAESRRAVDGQELEAQGWRLEPRSRVQRQTWKDLARLSEAVEIKTVPLLGRAVISDVLLHQDRDLSPGVMALLPSDVRDAVAEVARHDD